jgi:hypothetical protein
MGTENQHLKLGLIGLSPGNGHPFSWAAIFNGYEPEMMDQCGFPAIPQYLFERKYPGDFLQCAKVTHVWTQDSSLTDVVAAASRIPNKCGNFTEMIGHVDALLLARDDAENHQNFVSPFLSEGIPVYIDKPFAHSLNSAERLLDMRQYPSQIFSCSALLYADELYLTEEELSTLGTIRRIEGSVPNLWEKYSIHVIEPILHFLGRLNEMENHHVDRIGKSTKLLLSPVGQPEIHLEASGYPDRAISIRYIGENGEVCKIFKDSFTAFRTALNRFCQQVKTKKNQIPLEHTLATVRCIELGLAK